MERASVPAPRSSAPRDAAETALRLVVRGLGEASRPAEIASRARSAVVRLAFAVAAERNGLVVGGGPHERLDRLARVLERWGVPLDPALRPTEADRAKLLDGIDSFATDAVAIGAAYESLLGLDVVVDRSGADVIPGERRKRLGAHYTSRPLARDVAERTLAPLLARRRDLDALLSLRVCDPSMGSGVFLLAACEVIVARGREIEPELPAKRLVRDVARHCLHGVDRDAGAAEVARLALWLEVGDPTLPATFADDRLVVGDAVVCASRAELAESIGERALAGLLARAKQGDRDATTELRRAAEDALDPRVRSGASFAWVAAFPAIVEPPRAGFDAIVGNPPWVSYAGRAAHPIAPALRDFLSRRSRAFAGYRNLQGVFVERAAEMLRPGGRLGLVLPSSMSELGGYAPVRAAHDALATPDDELPEYGDEFEGVFQPCMALVSTRTPRAKTGPWPLARNDLDLSDRELLARVADLPTFPATLFGERGFQSTRDDELRDARSGRFATPLHVGGDVEPFRIAPPRLFCDRAALRGRLRSDAEFAAIPAVVRQTARFPIAALHDGLPFRNSLLAILPDATYPAPAVVAWLNSAPVRWLHYVRHRDARNGIPQVKIAHLRAIPAPSANAIPRLAALCARNRAIDWALQSALDDVAAEELRIDAKQLRRIRAWHAALRR